MTKAQAQKKWEAAEALANRTVELLRELRDEMQEHFDDKSEKWQEGEKGTAWEAAIEAVEMAADDTESAISEVPDFSSL